MNLEPHLADPPHKAPGRPPLLQQHPDLLKLQKQPVLPLQPPAEPEPVVGDVHAAMNWIGSEKFDFLAGALQVVQVWMLQQEPECSEESFHQLEVDL